MGRTLDNAMLNLGLKDKFGEGLDLLGFNVEDILESERDAALGNGGLGRLAACYVDSGATCEIPLWGYGLRCLFPPFTYPYLIKNCPKISLWHVPTAHRTRWFPIRGVCIQVGIFMLLLTLLCSPDPWLDHANPWEIPRLDVTVDVRFGGHAEKLEGGRGIWSGGQEVLAVAYDVPIPGTRVSTIFTIP